MKITDYPTVPIESAELLTKNWRLFFANSQGIPDHDGPNIFRGFNVHIDTLKQLVALAEKDPNINAVRIYLAKASPSTVGNDVHVLLNPCHNGAAGDPLGNIDILEIDGVSTIMDFTSPCPPLCATTSRLYTDIPPGEISSI